MRDVVWDEMRRRIVEGSYRPGERLVEDRVAVREAFRVHEPKGFVTIVARRAACVTTFTAEEARQVLEVLRELDSLAARFAARAGR